jgi:hypothetical protein
MKTEMWWRYTSIKDKKKKKKKKKKWCTMVLKNQENMYKKNYEVIVKKI